MTSIRPGINFVNTYSSANKCRNNKKVLRDNKKGVSPKRVNRTLEIYSLPNMDTPPYETDELETRDIKLTAITKVARDKKGIIIISEILSKDRTNLDLDSDGKKKTPSVSNDFIHESPEVNTLDHDIFSLNETIISNKNNIKKQSTLTNFFPTIHQSPIPNSKVGIDMEYHQYIVDDSPKGHALKISNAILEHEENTIDEDYNTKQDLIPTLPHQYNTPFSFIFHQNHKTSSTTADAFKSKGGVVITKMEAMENTTRSDSTDNKRIPKYFFNSTRTPSTYLDPFVTTEAKNNVMYPEGNYDCNISINKDSNSTSSKKMLNNSKLKITRSFQHINTRIPYVRSNILHNSSHKKKIERSRATQNTKYSQPHRISTVDYPNQSSNPSQSVDNNLSIVYSRNPRTPATKENNINH